MYLNETILQSRTTLTLVEFIDKLMSIIKLADVTEDKDVVFSIMKDYEEIKRQTNKAVKKRSFK